MSFPVTPQQEDYFWVLSQHQSFIEDMEKTLRVICILDFTEESISLIDDYYLLTVAKKSMTDKPREDIEELAYLWLALIQIAKGEIQWNGNTETLIQ